MRVITLLTDFGTRDSYVAEMKGVILSLVSQDIEIIDISHDISPQNILEASFILANSFYYFPEKTVHLAVVDPGVGTDRDIIVVTTEHYSFVAPDNGILFEAVNFDGIKEVRSIDKKRFRDYMFDHYGKNSVAERIFGVEESKTFHGRDIFAPLAAFCFLGEDWNSFSKKKNTILDIHIPRPSINGNKVFGKIVYVDHFGNLITNIHINFLKDLINNYKKIGVFIKLKGSLVSVGRLLNTYSDAEEGKPLALVGSRGYIELAVNGGNASRYFGAHGKEEVVIIIS